MHKKPAGGTFSSGAPNADNMTIRTHLDIKIKI